MNSDFKKFYKKASLISLPVVLWFAWQNCLPLEQYTFRSWEALLAKRGWFQHSPFYPDQRIEMIEAGDLSPYTKNAVPKKVVWETDHEGFRNSEPVCADPFAVVIGDSMAIGTSLTQSDTLSEVLSRKTGRCVRSFAGGKIGESADGLFELGLHPKWVVLVLVERMAETTDDLQKFNHHSAVHFRFFENFSSLKTAWQRMRSNIYWNYRSAHGIVSAVTRSLISPQNATGVFIPQIASSSTENHIFYHGDTARIESADPALFSSIIKNLNHFSSELRQYNAKLIVTFVPNKETTYYQDRGIPESQFGARFQQEAKNFDFLYIDLIGKFKKSYAADKRLLHHTDDTHWNADGVNLLVSEIIPDLQFSP